MKKVTALLVILMMSSIAMALGEMWADWGSDQCGAANDPTPGDSSFFWWVDGTYAGYQTGAVNGNESNYDGMDLAGGVGGTGAIDLTGSKWSPRIGMAGSIVGPGYPAPPPYPSNQYDSTWRWGAQADFTVAGTDFIKRSWGGAMITPDIAPAGTPIDDGSNGSTAYGMRFDVMLTSDGTNQRLDLIPTSSADGAEPYAQYWLRMRNVFVDYNDIDNDGISGLEFVTNPGQHRGLVPWGTLNTERDRLAIATGLSTGIIDVKIDVDGSTLYTANETADWRDDTSGGRYTHYVGIENIEVNYFKATVSYRDNGDSTIAGGDWSTPAEFGMEYGWNTDMHKRTHSEIYGYGYLDYTELDIGTTRDLVGQGWAPAAWTMAMAGDADRDGDCDYSEGFLPPNDGVSDLNVLIANKGSGTTWNQGDFDGDGDVDYSEGFLPPNDGVSDLNILIAMQGVVVAQPAVGADQSTGVAEMIYNYLTGEVLFDNGGGIDMMQVYDANGGVIVANITDYNGESVFDSSANHAQYFSTTGLPTGEHSIGLVLPTGIASSAEGVSLFFQYQAPGSNPVLGDIVFIPEPATMLLLGFGGVVALIRRKR